MKRHALTVLGGSLMLLAPNVSAALILADTNNGNINTATTWVGDATPPASGDMNQWGTSTFTIRATTETWEGQEMLVQTGGRFASGSPGPTVSFNGDLTLNGGTITVLNNNPFVINLNNNTINLNSGILDSGAVNNGRDLIFTNASLAGSGTINVQGGAAAAASRSAVIMQNSVATSGFTGLFTVTTAANFFLPNIDAANASFGIDVNGSGQLGLTNNTSVTSAIFDGLSIDPGTYTRDQLLGLGVNTNRVLAANATGTLTVVPEPSAALLGALGLLALFRRHRA